MKYPILSLISAIDEKRGIGKGNKLLWLIPSDLKRFKQLTMRHPIIMGRKTYESIGKVLPGRKNIIITRDISYTIPGAFVCHSLNEAIEEAKKEEREEIFVIGGGQIYREALDDADRVYLTTVKGSYHADVFFPKYEDLFEIEHETDWSEENGIMYKYVDLVKKKSDAKPPSTMQ